MLWPCSLRHRGEKNQHFELTQNTFHITPEQSHVL